MRKIITFSLAALVLFTLAACSGGITTVASTIAIDVNPSVVLELDEDDRVINVILNNEDAEIIVGDMDLIGVDYNVALNALLGSMIANGYINELANSILLSIQNSDETKESNLLAEISQAINDYLTGSSIEGSVITQSLDLDPDAEELAQLLGISEAKAELILEIIEIDPRMVVEELALLSINDLNLLLEVKNYVMDDVEKSGSASQLDLITAIEAYQAALLELGLEESSVVEFEVKLEQEDGIMVYEVEIETDTEEFELLIHAKEGTVYIEMDDDDYDDVFPEDAYTEEEIMALVATEFGLDESLIIDLDVSQEVDNGVAYYEIEFEYGNAEYELEVDAQTGEFYTNSIDIDGYDNDDYDDEDEMDDESEDDMDDESEDDMDDQEDSEDNGEYDTTEDTMAGATVTN
jgi:uncharacterized membrane protein YkoI